MALEAGRQLVLDYVAAFNAFDMDRLRALFVPEPQIFGVLGSGGLDMVEPIWRELHFGLDMKLEVVALAAEDDKVAARLRETGRFIGPFRGLAGHDPTGRAYEIVAMEWFEIEDGRIARRWGARDSAAITRQVLGR
jgi:predicted ester cyclase